MLGQSKAYSGFSVDDLAKGLEFYGETLGLETEVLDEENGLVTLHLAGDRPTLMYASQIHSPGSYTILNFPVEDVEATVDALVERGVEFERYDQFDQDERGIVRSGGPRVAWFKDPAGNVLSVLEEA